MKKDFNKWYDSLTDTIANYEYYVDFTEVYKNIDRIKIPLSLLSTLIGSKNIEKEFDKLIIDYPEVIECIPLLIAVRKKQIKIIDKSSQLIFNFNKMNDFNLLKRFMNKTGLFDLIQNHIRNNLFDYVMGIEVGLASNSRKNKGGHLMEAD